MPIQRPALVADIPHLWALRTRAIRASCASHYAPEIIDTWCAAAPPERMAALLEAGGGLLEEEEGRALGFAILNLDTGELDAAFVDPAQQGRGIARRLLAALDSLALEAGFERLFLSASLNAVPFYQAAGYVELRRETYAHRSGIELASSYMEKRLTRS